MSAKDDLRNKIESLKSQLEEAKASLHQILCDEFPLRPGTIVIRSGRMKERYLISSIRILWGSPKAFGKKFLKSGLPGEKEWELYGDIKPEPSASPEVQP